MHGNYSEVLAEMQQMIREHDLSSMFDVEAIIEIVELRRIGDSLERLADTLEEFTRASVADRRVNTQIADSLLKSIRGAMAAHFNTDEVTEAAQRACEEPGEINPK